MSISFDKKLMETHSKSWFTIIKFERSKRLFTTDYLMSIAPDNERVGKFYDYLIDYYINEGAKFNPHIWASRERTINNSLIFLSLSPPSEGFRLQTRVWRRSDYSESPLPHSQHI
ncbi:Uncharacterized protein FWK35_00016206 [Aphis craccivora]|uniref:Uncharacterized protein n=1 Tax=Aphis craccivora TaxID=307492 RepID=A0A6G0YZ54_APHCR|nr:Uncharacterized protein FWK35_00016206 [Aphis craccivora]